MTALSVARRLARFACGLRLADMPPAVIAQAELLALDTLGSCLASSTMDFGASVLDTAASLGGAPESTLVGRSTRVGAANAVLANGTLAHGLDFDDTREDAIVHTGCVAVTSALAAGEAAGASGAAVVEGIVAGVEIMCRIGLAVPGRFHARHFHPTSLTASFAAAVVAGKLGGLSEDQLVNALGICGAIRSAGQGALVSVRVAQPAAPNRLQRPEPSAPPRFSGELLAGLLRPPAGEARRFGRRPKRSISAQSSTMPAPVNAEQVRAIGTQTASAGRIRRKAC